MKENELKINQKVYFLNQPMHPTEDGLTRIEIKEGKIISINTHETKGHVQYRIDNDGFKSYTKHSINSSLFLTKKNATIGAINHLKDRITLHEEIINEYKKDIEKLIKLNYEYK